MEMNKIMFLGYSLDKNVDGNMNIDYELRKMYGFQDERGNDCRENQNHRHKRKEEKP